MKSITITMVLLAAVFLGCQQVKSMDKSEKPMAQAPGMTATAVFAGGCFWCTESDFEKIDGVIEAVSGYTGGRIENPTYKQVSAGGTGHIEAVKVIYDPTKISYEKLLDVFWRHVDPTDKGGQFVDRGAQYRAAIFYASEEEKRLAEASRLKLEDSGLFGKPIVTEILPLGKFYDAEDYHQDYYKKNPLRYRWYRSGSGRDQFLEKTWAGMKTDVKQSREKIDGMDDSAMKDGMDTAIIKKSEGKKMESGMMDPGVQSTMPDASGAIETGTSAPSAKGGGMPGMYTRPPDAELKSRLNPLQYKVTQQNGTEAPFKNAYWYNHGAGIYTDIVSGEPLFSSKDKFDSGTGWPSFTRPLAPENIVKKTDRSLWTVRTEVRSSHGDSHLGHLFDDGPAPTGQRYCINSAALRFIPVQDLEKEGYGEYRKLFE